MRAARFKEAYIRKWDEFKQWCFQERIPKKWPCHDRIWGKGSKLCKKYSRPSAILHPSSLDLSRRRRLVPSKLCLASFFPAVVWDDSKSSRSGMWDLTSTNPRLFLNGSIQALYETSANRQRCLLSSAGLSMSPDKFCTISVSGAPPLLEGERWSDFPSLSLKVLWGGPQRV